MSQSNTEQSNTPSLGQSGGRDTTFRDVLPLFKGRTITGYATGATGDRLQVLALTFDDKSWAQLTLSNPPGIRVDVYAADGKRIYSDG